MRTTSAQREALRKELHDFDPYGKDAVACTSGKDMVFRRARGDDGRVNWSIIPPEEIEAARLPKKSKAETNRRGNRCL
jgi:hypothetical protein